MPKSIRGVISPMGTDKEVSLECQSESERLEFELVFNYVTVKHVNHYTTKIPSAISMLNGLQNKDESTRQ